MTSYDNLLRSAHEYIIALIKPLIQNIRQKLVVSIFNHLINLQ